jgi:truncated hemoglobin YjbI
MGRSWMKQRLDLPRLMEGRGVDMSRASDKVKQKLGYFTQVPASYDEYYAAPEARKYRQRAE